jgi:hypothetical protein
MPRKRKPSKASQKANCDLDALAELVADKLNDELLVDRIASEIIDSSNRDKMMQYVDNRIHALRISLANAQEWLRNLLLEIRILQDLLHERTGISRAEIEQYRREKTLELFLQEEYWTGLNVSIARGNGNKGDGTQHVNCRERRRYCGGACCFIGFSLTVDEIKEGIIGWDEDHPFKIKHNESSACIHWNFKTKGCEIYEDRPIVCRQYSCKDDRRIWLNYEEKVINPKLKQRMGAKSVKPRKKR